MAPHHFDVRGGGNLTVDDDGRELPDIEAVQARGRAISGRMAAVRPTEYDPRRMAIEVRDPNRSRSSSKFTFASEVTGQK